MTVLSLGAARKGVKTRPDSEEQPPERLACRQTFGKAKPYETSKPKIHAEHQTANTGEFSIEEINKTLKKFE